MVYQAVMLLLLGWWPHKIDPEGKCQVEELLPQCPRRAGQHLKSVSEQV